MLLTQQQLLGQINNGILDIPVLVAAWADIGANGLGDIDVVSANRNGDFLLGDFGPDAGDVEPGDPMSTFQIPVNLLAESNTIELIYEPGGDTFQINSLGLQTGAVFPLPVPEPSTFLALGMGSLGLTLWAERRGMKRASA